MKVNLDLGEQLWRTLPQLYRERDNAFRAEGQPEQPGDLRLWLAAQGDLLERVHRTLVQMLYDHFPDEAGADENGTPRSCQPWLLPYFAQLLDVAVVSPDLAGQRAEVDNAVAWRQRKGTLAAVEAIAEAVGRSEVETVEGWRRVVVTPRAGDPLLPARALGEAEELDMDSLPPSRRARHPGLPSGTIDFRQRARAVQCDPGNPVAQSSTMGGVPVTWRVAHPHGAPCFPGSYQDPSRRTVDLRTPTLQRGHFHPRRLLMFLPPPAGYFGGTRSIPWASISDQTTFQNDDVTVSSGTTTFGGVEMPLRTVRGRDPENPLAISSVVEVGPGVVYRFENIRFVRTLTVNGDRVELEGCAVRKLVVETPVTAEPVVVARNTLFRTVRAARGLVRLEYCTVLFLLIAEALEASDCIIVPQLRRNVTGTEPPRQGCLRYSRLEPQEALPRELLVHERSVTRLPAWFLSERFGEPGCGVLHPAAAEALRAGAEDGGEMGAYHERRYCLRQSAVLAKLAEFLPVGIEAVSILDTTMACPPPAPSKVTP